MLRAWTRRRRLRAARRTWDDEAHAIRRTWAALDLACLLHGRLPPPGSRERCAQHVADTLGPRP